MTLHKKVLATAVVAGLFATAAQAQVVISAPTTIPVLYAGEIVSTTTAPVTLAAIPENQIRTALLYNFSPSEVRHARIECSSHIRIATGSVISSNANTTIGAINGLGTHAIHFSITSGASPNQALATDTLTITGDRSITSTAAGTCSYALYDTPSQAANGGTTGQIVGTGSRSYLTVGPSFRLTVSAPRTSIANVETAAPNPVFGDFVADTPTTLSTAALASVLFDVQPVTSQPRLAGGALVASATQLSTILAPASAIRVNANNDGFSAAASASGLYDADAQARVYLTAPGVTPATCASQIGSSGTMTAIRANFPSGNLATVGVGHVALASTPRLLCLERRAGNAIPASDFTVQYDAVGQTGFAPTSLGAVPSGNIVRNGTQLQAPLVQTPAGYISRVALTNASTVGRPFTWTFHPASGSGTTEASTTYTGPTTGSGTIPASGSTVMSLVELLGTAATNFNNTPPRGTFTVNVAGPNSQIQGLYQIVNPSTGSISNHVMVRPGTN